MSESESDDELTLAQDAFFEGDTQRCLALCASLIATEPKEFDAHQVWRYGNDSLIIACAYLMKLAYLCHFQQGDFQRASETAQEWGRLCGSICFMYVPVLI
jgi:hypothetical protein